jgi:MSHA biogenesis protein MshK
MSPSPVTRHSSLAVALALMLFSASAVAQVGNDPTRPPTGFGAGAVDADVADTGGGMTLQSVMITPTSKAAIISGVTVKLGEKYGDAVLVKVAENEVVLKSGATSQVLKLYPGVEKRDTAPTPAKTAPRRPRSGSKAVPAADGAASPG